MRFRTRAAFLLVSTLSLVACQALGKLTGSRELEALGRVGDSAAKAALERNELELLRRRESCRALRERSLAFPTEQRLGAVEVVALTRRLAQQPGGRDAGAGPAGPWLALTEDELVSIDENLNVLGLGLAAFSSRPTLPWVFGVLDLERPAVFSSAGGFVFVTAGLLARVENEAQLAAVLSLGITSVASHRDLRRLQRAREAECLARLTNERSSELVRSAAAPLGGQSGVNIGTANVSLDEQVVSDFITRVFVRGVEADEVAAWEDELVATAVETAAFAGHRVSDASRLLASLPADDRPLGLDGPALAASIERHAAALKSQLHLSAPRSPAAEQIRRRVGAR